MPIKFLFLSTIVFVNFSFLYCEKSINVNKLLEIDYNYENLNTIFDGTKKFKSNKIIIDLSDNDNIKTVTQANTNIVVKDLSIKDNFLKVSEPKIERAVLNGDDKEKQAIDDAFETINKVGGKYGNELYKLKDKVDIIWDDMDEDEYAKSIPPTSFLFFKESSKIVLNKKYKDVFLTSEYLSIVLAHELSHQEDFNNYGNLMNNDALRYITEEKGYSAQLYFYEVIKKQEPYLFDKSKIKYEPVLKFIDIQQFLKDIWDYKNNNGKAINEINYPNLNTIGKFETKKFTTEINSDYEKKNNFKHGYTFHAFITVGYGIKDKSIQEGLKSDKVKNNFFGVRDNLITDIYKPYCNLIGKTPESDNILFSYELPNFETNYNNQQNQPQIPQNNEPPNYDGNYQNQPNYDNNNHDNEYGINPGPPPDGWNVNPNWDGI